MGLIIIGLLVLVGCTRPEEKSSRVSVTLPSVQSQKTSQALSATMVWEHVVVNVSAPDMPLVYCLIDVEEKRITGPCKIDGLNLSLDVPSGSDRLIQVTLVGSDGERMSFHYGDVKKQLAPGTNDPLLIYLSQIAEVKDVGGKVRGRFLRADGAGPTGVLDIKFSVGEKPPMIVNRTEIVNGWFQAFLVPGLGFDFILDGKVNLFGNKMNIESFAQLADVLPYDRIDKYTRVDGSRTDYEFYGYFGPGSVGTGKVACKYSETPCLSATAGKTEFVDFLFSDKSEFNSAFVRYSSGQTLSVDAQTISWKTLPGVKDVIDGFRLFYLPASLTEADLARFKIGEHAFDCGLMQFHPAVVGIAKISANESSYTLGNSYDLTNGKLALCPFKGVVNLRSIASHNLNDHEGGGGGPYLRLEPFGGTWGNSGSNYSLDVDVCIKVKGVSYISTGVNTANASPVATATSISIGISANYYLFDSDTSCSVGSPSVSSPLLNIAAGSSESSNYYWIKFMSSGTFELPLSRISGDDLELDMSHNQFIVSPL